MFAPIQTCRFKAYDLRGQVSNDLNDDIDYPIGHGLVAQLGRVSYVGGRDMRLTDEMLLARHVSEIPH